MAATLPSDGPGRPAFENPDDRRRAFKACVDPRTQRIIDEAAVKFGSANTGRFLDEIANALAKLMKL